MITTKFIKDRFVGVFVLSLLIGFLVANLNKFTIKGIFISLFIASLFYIIAYLIVKRYYTSGYPHIKSYPKVMTVWGMLMLLLGLGLFFYKWFVYDDIVLNKMQHDVEWALEYIPRKLYKKYENFE